MAASSVQAVFKIWRGDRSGGQFNDYTTEITEGMVVLDAVHQIQAESANDLAVRWNCKAGKCGSCSAERCACDRRPCGNARCHGRSGRRRQQNKSPGAG